MGAKILRRINGVFDSDSGLLTSFVDENGREVSLNVTQTQVRIGVDVYFINGAGVPVDYTDGSPPATGEGVTGIGSLYTDITNGKLYINGGTKAQPVWKLVTSAA